MKRDLYLNGLKLTAYHINGKMEKLVSSVGTDLTADYRLNTDFFHAVNNQLNKPRDLTTVYGEWNGLEIEGKFEHGDMEYAVVLSPDGSDIAEELRPSVLEDIEDILLDLYRDM